MINGPRLEQKVFGIHTLSGLPKSDLIPSLAVSVAIIDTIHLQPHPASADEGCRP